MAFAVVASLVLPPLSRGADKKPDCGGAIEFLARNMWLIVPVQAKIKEFF